MRPLRALGIYVVAVFVGGALLAPWNYWLIQSFSDQFPELASSPFARFLTTTMMMVALAALWPLLKALGVTSLRETGLVHPAGHSRQLIFGLAFGLGSLAVLAVAAMLFGARQFSTSLTVSRFFSTLWSASLTAAGVAVIEELLFRGGIFGGLRRVLKWPVALVVSSMIYSATHFIEDADFSGTVTWLSGLELLPRIFGGDAEWSRLIPRFVNLTVAGGLLALAFQRTGNLWCSIGIHAGWVFWLLAYRRITKSIPETTEWVWGSGRMIDGWLAVLFLSTLLAAAWKGWLPGFRHNPQKQ
ncbi:MAG TPA: CPBP family intramembrane metalloprotease [Verrucomicrobiota bacterium]|nr:CPBP family intramembrane metalloprotease [Verrucomicrobiota bacterium]